VTHPTLEAMLRSDSERRAMLGTPPYASPHPTRAASFPAVAREACVDDRLWKK